MTAPADSNQLRNTISSQGATIGRHEELLRGLMEGFQTLAELHDRALNTFLEQFRGLSVRQSTTTITYQHLSNPAVSRAASPATLISWEPRLPPSERFDGESGTSWAFLAQCSLIIELQPSSFPSDHSKIVYLITMMSRRALVWATAVWEQQSAGCMLQSGGICGGGEESFRCSIARKIGCPEATPASKRLPQSGRL